MKISLPLLSLNLTVFASGEVMSSGDATKRVMTLTGPRPRLKKRWND